MDSLHQHSYAVAVAWKGNLGEGTSHYRSYSRDHTVSSSGLPDLLGSADATFRGDAARWNPELLLVTALSQCHLLSYLHVCVTRDVVVTSYVDEATGRMETDRQGGGRFVEVLLRPRITVDAKAMVAPAREVHEHAHELCFIANSVNFPVRHEPVVTVG